MIQFSFAKANDVKSMFEDVSRSAMIPQKTMCVLKKLALVSFSCPWSSVLSGGTEDLGCASVNVNQTPSIQGNHVTLKNSVRVCVCVHREAFSTSLPSCKVMRLYTPEGSGLKLR